jgi:hypothetical protein
MGFGLPFMSRCLAMAVFLQSHHLTAAVRFVCYNVCPLNTFYSYVMKNVEGYLMC